VADEDFAGHNCGLQASVSHAGGVGLVDFGFEELGDQREEGVGEEMNCACCDECIRGGGLAGKVCFERW
jgi:hypothetical protein